MYLFVRVSISPLFIRFVY